MHDTCVVAVRYVAHDCTYNWYQDTEHLFNKKLLTALSVQLSVHAVVCILSCNVPKKPVVQVSSYIDFIEY